MVYGCVVHKCRLKRKEGGHPISFHNFPRAGPQRDKWISTLGQCDDWKLKNHHKVCSMHFEESAIKRTGKTARLREGAVPTIFFENLPEQVVKHRRIAMKQADPFAIVTCGSSSTQPLLVRCTLVPSTLVPGTLVPCTLVPVTSTSSPSPITSTEQQATSSGSSFSREIDTPDSTQTSKPFHFLQGALRGTPVPAATKVEPEICENASWSEHSNSSTFHLKESLDSTQPLEPFMFLDCGQMPHKDNAVKINEEKSDAMRPKNGKWLRLPPHKSLNDFKNWMKTSEKQLLENELSSSEDDYFSDETSTPQITQINVKLEVGEPLPSFVKSLRVRLRKTEKDLVSSRKKVKILLQYRRRLLKKCAEFQQTIEELRKRK